MTILCSDKTGTITQNRLKVTAVDALPGVRAEEALRAACLASKAENKDAIDSAVLAEAGERKVAIVGYAVTQFVPFSAATRCTKTSVRLPSGEVCHAQGGGQNTAGASSQLKASDGCKKSWIVTLRMESERLRSFRSTEN